jgi:hypothetical protein
MKFLLAGVAALLLAGCAVVPVPVPGPGVSVGVGVPAPVYRYGYGHRHYPRGHYGHYPYRGRYRHW